MPRPCVDDHPPRPNSCRICRWCADDSDIGAFHRRQWGEPAPSPSWEGGYAYPEREIVPGLLDPIPEAALQPVPERWPHDTRVMRRHREALLRLARADMPSPGPRHGAGVLLVGGGKYWPGIVIALKMLRDAGSTLPVQIWHRGSQEPVRRADLAGIADVELHDLTALTPTPRVLAGWEAKTLALLACGWERVFFQDADAYCLVDPAQRCWIGSRPRSRVCFWKTHPAPRRQ